MTWAPDGRATFEYGEEQIPAEPHVIWRQAARRAPDHVAYWDVVAALTTVGDMARCMPPLLDHDRPDLDAPTLTARRDAFLSAALTRLDS